MTHAQKTLVFSGLRAGLAVSADQIFYDALSPIFSHWPFSVESDSSQETFAALELKDGRYTLSSPFMDKPLSYGDPVNAICAIVAELAWLRLREDPSLLCLHGAAAEVAGRLVVFPATRRAGKSTLSVALAAAGIRMFTDDFLPLSIADNGIISGISNGISPRLRLPIPEQIGPVAKKYISDRQTIANRQYAYVAPAGAESVRFNERAPLGAIVFLDRKDGNTPELNRIGKAEALKVLIKQNFSRAGNAGDILSMLEFLAHNLPAYTLSYDDAEPAIDLIKSRFSSWEAPLATYQPEAVLCNEVEDGLKPYTKYDNVTVGQFEQAEGIKVVSSDGKQFLTGRNGQSIHYLNEGAAMIWQILSEPTDLNEAVEILLAAFPELEHSQVKNDVLRCFKDFAVNGLLRKLETTIVAGPQPARLHAN